jgi:hypothetical protein
MKKHLLFVIILTIGTTFAFAQFDLDQFDCYVGLNGSYGTAGSAMFNVQAGYNFLFAYNDNEFKLAVLSDLGVGYRYGNNQIKGYEPKRLDYHAGVIGEFYFLPFMGVGLGAGITPCICEYPGFAKPYIRAAVPFQVEYVKFGVGFDYLFQEKENHENVPFGYRINLFASLRIMDLYKRFSKGGN